MSATDENGEEIPTREIAYRLFAAEYDDASFSYAESDEERAPNYVISPTGARLNRIFVVGTLTEITSVNDEMVRARVVDPTGAFVVYAGQYQPDALATLEQLEPPAFVAVTGKARTFQPDDSDQVYTSIRPESIATVDAATRDRWVVSAAEQTVDRIGTYATGTESDASGDALADALQEAGVEAGLADGIPLALDHYGATPAYLDALRDCALEAVEVVAGERDQVTPLSLQPGDSPDADATFSSLAAHANVDLSSLESAVETEPEAESQPAEPTAATAGVGDAEMDGSVDTGSESIDAGSAAGTATGSEPDAASDAESAAAEAAADSELESESDADTETDTGDAAAAVGTDDSTAAGDADETDEQTASFDESTDVDEAGDTGTSDTTGDPDSADAAEADEGAEDDLGDFDAGDTGMYEMDDEEREQLEEEFGAEFTTGSEVEEPGEAGIDVPEPEDELEDAADTESADADAESADVGADSADSGAEPDDDLGEPPASGLETESESDAEATNDGDTEAEADETDIDATDDTAPSESDAESESDADEEPAEDVDLEDYVVDTMADLDDGDGADRSTLVETVADEIGASEDEVEDAIQDALMGGQCYEPNDETLKPI